MSAACKICGHATVEIGSVDFSKNCEERNGLYLPPTGTSVPYRRCTTCGFAFTDAFDRWPHERFAERIYNDDYPVVDPDYTGARAAAMAKLLLGTFGVELTSRSLLDYGSGSGQLEEQLRRAGMPDVRSYDPFSASARAALERRFDFVTCFEVLEHDPDPVATVERIAALAKDDGLVVLSTLVQGAEFERLGLGWWYVAPRNGHISIFSRTALATLWQSAGFRVASMNDDIHVAFRTIPDFARALFARVSG